MIQFERQKDNQSLEVNKSQEQILENQQLDHMIEVMPRDKNIIEEYEGNDNLMKDMKDFFGVHEKLSAKRNSQNLPDQQKIATRKQQSILKPGENIEAKRIEEEIIDNS